MPLSATRKTVVRLVVVMAFLATLLVAVAPAPAQAEVQSLIRATSRCTTPGPASDPAFPSATVTWGLLPQDGVSMDFVSWTAGEYADFGGLGPTVTVVLERTGAVTVFEQTVVVSITDGGSTTEYEAEVDVAVDCSHLPDAFWSVDGLYQIDSNTFCGINPTTLANTGSWTVNVTTDLGTIIDVDPLQSAVVFVGNGNWFLSTPGVGEIVFTVDQQLDVTLIPVGESEETMTQFVTDLTFDCSDEARVVGVGPGDPPPPPPPAPPPPSTNRFIDDDGSIFEADIEKLAEAEITFGCNPPVNDMFCPDAVVTRGAMAAFLVRALGYSDDDGGDVFVDDDGSVFEGDIDRLGTAGVTKGCNPPVNDMFCPGAVVTRGAMAAFLVRALGYSDDGGGDVFVDDDGSVFEGDIDKLGTAGVTKGCNPPANDMFCPNGAVTRGAMAAFLVRALDL